MCSYAVPPPANSTLAFDGATNCFDKMARRGAYAHREVVKSALRYSLSLNTQNMVKVIIKITSRDRLSKRKVDCISQ